jgi:hypothetical protein
MSNSLPPFRPAFATRAQALRFALLLVALLAGPIVFARFWPGVRVPLHRLTDHAGLFALQERVYDDSRPDLDILFIGDSFLRFGIDAAYVEQELSKALGRPARVLTFGFQHRGEEVYYLALRDLLAHHKRPKLLVVDLPEPFLNLDRPHPWDWEIVSPGESPSFYEGLGWRYRFPLYAEQVLGMPRTLFSLLHERGSASIKPDDHGSMLRDEGFEGAPFATYSPPPPPLAPEQIIYSETTKGGWRFENQTLLPYADNFDRKLMRLAVENDIPIAELEVPLYSRRKLNEVIELTNWPAYFGAPIHMLGIPPTQLFAGLSDDEVKKLYWNDHMNANGSHYFTKAIMPALVQLYREVSAPPVIKEQQP